jgi:hypothetical protein
MISYIYDRTGFFTLALENGEAWRPLDGDPSVSHWFRKSDLYDVTVTAGALGSFNLHVKGAATSYRVRRVS